MRNQSSLRFRFASDPAICIYSAFPDQPARTNLYSFEHQGIPDQPQLGTTRRAEQLLLLFAIERPAGLSSALAIELSAKYFWGGQRAEPEPWRLRSRVRHRSFSAVFAWLAIGGSSRIVP